MRVDFVSESTGKTKMINQEHRSRHADFYVENPSMRREKLRAPASHNLTISGVFTGTPRCGGGLQDDNSLSKTLLKRDLDHNSTTPLLFE